MSKHRRKAASSKKQWQQEQIIIALVVAGIILLIAVSAYVIQSVAEQDAFTRTAAMNSKEAKDQYELFKLAAEIKQIRSDTGGSLFWLKLVAIFVTVGGAVGGYLLGQSRATRDKIDFEQRKNVDLAYQSIIVELSDPKPVLRTAAAVKLGTILKTIPVEWNLENEDERKEEIVQLTKRVLASALAIESNPKVLKTLTIELARHKPWEGDPDKKKAKRANISEVDLSRVKAADAYWARVDFSYTDFYAADLKRTSFRESLLLKAQFRESNLQDAVFIDSICEDANFKMADLRNADFTGANLIRARFEEAKVNGIKLTNARIGDNPDVYVDESLAGDGSGRIAFNEWYAKMM